MRKERFAMLEKSGCAIWQEDDASLRRARLKLVTTPLFMQCPCGFEGELGAGEFAGHIGICPDCDRVAEIDGALELVAMSYADIEPFGAA